MRTVSAVLPFLLGAFCPLLLRLFVRVRMHLDVPFHVMAQQPAQALPFLSTTPMIPFYRAAREWNWDTGGRDALGCSRTFMRRVSCVAADRRDIILGHEVVLRAYSLSHRESGTARTCGGAILYLFAFAPYSSSSSSSSALDRSTRFVVRRSDCDPDDLCSRLPA